MNLPLNRVHGRRFTRYVGKKPYALVLRSVEGRCHVIIGLHATVKKAEQERDRFRFSLDYSRVELWPAEQFSIIFSSRLASFMDL